MPSLPNKSIKGGVFKKWVVESIDKLIDYLSSTYIQVGQGLEINRTPSGLVIELAKPAKETQNSTTGGTGTTQDISATVSGGTAFIGLSDSTSTAELVGTGDVTISGNTNGQIEISAMGGTGSTNFFPDYGETPISVSADTIYTYATDMWLIGQVGLYTGSAPAFPAHVYLNVYSGDGTFIRDFVLFEDSGVCSGYSNNNGSYVPVCIPLTHGYKFKVVTAGSIDFTLNIYHI